MARSINQEEYELMSTDAKYRNFVQQVDKALKSFEYTTEWADLVNALGKLNKVLQNNTRFQIVPRRYFVGRRLAQCMHPALPSGVHLKALETYDQIFKMIGSDRLVQELSIYSNGLFPLLSQAAINVKPTLIEIYEHHFLPLGSRLKPALDGFIVAVLPGLEEGSDHHDSTNSLLKKVCEQVNPEFFYGSLWRCILNNPNVRLPAINFIILHYQKKKKLEDQLYIMGDDQITLMHGICACLLDHHVLVQRTILDLLLVCFPLSNCQMKSENIITIITAGLTVLLRRDMTLNRRLDSWLFGTEISGQNLGGNSDKKVLTGQISSRVRKKRENYFEQYSREYCLKAIVQCLSNISEVSPVTSLWSTLGEMWPYRLLICILDNTEIVNTILDSLCIQIFRIEKAKPDHVRLFNVLISNIGTEYLWQQFTKYLSNSCKTAGSTFSCFESDNPLEHIQPIGSENISFGEMLHIMDFMIDMTSNDNFPESTVQYLPCILLQILSCLQENCELIPTNLLNEAIHLLCRIVSKIQPYITFEASKEIGKGFDCLSDIKEECESLTSEIIKATENALNSSQEKLDEKFNCATNLQQVCCKIETFFVSIVCKRILLTRNSPEEINRYFESNVCKSYDFENVKINENVQVSDDCTTLYASLCNLLVQTALIKLNTNEMNNNGDTLSTDNQNVSLHADRQTPIWLKQLVILSYCTHSNTININYTSIACVLNLMSILKSQILEQPLQTALINLNANGSPVLDFNKSKSETNSTSTCIDFLFRQQDIQMLYNQTNYYLQIAERLWNNITDDLNAYHLQTVSLLQQLHNLLEDSPICEGVICASMAVNDEALAYDARNKFCKLFNITRDIKQQTTSSSTTIREFDRPLFFMLDALTHKLDAFNTLSLDWLNQCLVHNDIARILEPILLILLHPDTNRISVQHVNSQAAEESKDVCDQFDAKNRQEKVNYDLIASEANIYAVANSNGNVTYHTTIGNKKRLPSPNLSAKSVSILNDSKSKRWNHFKSGTPERDISNSSRQLPVNINMFFNPFGSLSSLGSDAIDGFDGPNSFGPNNSASINRRFPGRRLLHSNDELRKTHSASFLNTSLVQSNLDANDHDHDNDNEAIHKLMNDMLDKVVLELEMNQSENQIDGKSIHSSFSLRNNEVDQDGYESSSESSASETSSEPTRQTLSESFNASSWMKPLSVNQLHGHMLLYQRVYDHKRSLYALTTLWNLILSEPQKILFAMSTTSVSNRIGFRSQELQHICARHKKSVIGKGFYGELENDLLNAFRNSSFLELIVTTCLYYIRSYYPAQCRLNEDEIQGNQKVRILSCEILRLIFGELIGNLKTNGTFSTYINDMLNRCSVQKYILHTIVSSVYNFQSKDNQIMANGRNASNSKLTETDQYSDVLIDYNEKAGSPGFQEDMQKSLLKLLEQLIILEHRTWPQNLNNEKEALHGKKDNESRASRIRFQPQMSSLKYASNIMITSQSMFFSAVQTSLQQMHKANLHCNWLELVETSLPIANRSLTRIVVCVITQLCHNLENLAEKIELFEKQSISFKMPPNYLISVLKSFSNLCHYCLLDVTSSSTQPINGHQSLTSPLNASTTSLGPLQVLTNLFHTFASNDNNPDVTSTVRDSVSASNTNLNMVNSNVSIGNESLMSTRRTVLSHLPRIISSLLSLWNSVEKNEQNKSHKICKSDSTDILQALDANCVNDTAIGWQVMGSVRDVKSSILSLLNPISLIHGQHFMAAVAILWFDLKPVQIPFENKSEERRKPIIPEFSEQQISLVKLIASIRVLPMESVFQIIRQVMKQPPNSMLSRKKRVPLEVCLLQFLLAYIRQFPGSQLLECWRSVLSLLKEGSQHAVNQPPLQFHLLAVLHEFVQMAPLIEARKDQKDLQDVAQKLIDSCTTVAGGRLGQSRWLKRNLEVKPGPQHLLEHEDESEKEMDELSNKFDANSYDISNEITVAKYSVGALNALAEFVAPVLDVVYVSEEKEKVVPIVSNIMYYVTPYLRNHNKHNAPSFYSCSHLLASISGYQYLRKAWRKDAFELLLEPNFFQMESSCIGFWRTINDHLMTHDKTTFRDFLTRMTITQSASALNKIFSSKDQENELRAQLTKRLAFILFCSEKDQYQKYMPEIQEKLIETLRIYSSPLVQSHIFLCFRVLLLRMSSHQLTSLWPFIYTELSQIFIQIESELLPSTPETRKINRNSANMENFYSYQNNGPSSYAASLQVYLQACKLLDLAIALPSDYLPQFQLDRWAFINDPDLFGEDNNDKYVSALNAPYQPHIIRIEKLMSEKNSKPEMLKFKPRLPMLTLTEIHYVMELQPFFHTLVQKEKNRVKGEEIIASSLLFTDDPVNHNVNEFKRRNSHIFNKDFEDDIDKLIEADFIESINS